MKGPPPQILETNGVSAYVVECPDKRNDDTVRFTKDDLFLCPKCDQFRFGSSDITKKSKSNDKQSSKPQQCGPSSTKCSETRKCNVVMTGLLETASGSSDDDAKMFTRFCEENLTVKPALARRVCQRLGKRTDQRPRKLLIHLTSESSATSLLSASRNLHRNEATRGYYIHPDLSQAELKLAFEQRQRRRLTRQQTNSTSAGVSD